MDLAFCLKVPLDLLLVWASSEGSGETARMCRLAWTFAARIDDKYQIRLTQSILSRQRTTKVLIRLRGCAGWSAPLLFADGINRFSHDVIHIFVCSFFRILSSACSGRWKFTMHHIFLWKLYLNILRECCILQGIKFAKIASSQIIVNLQSDFSSEFTVRWIVVNLQSDFSSEFTVRWIVVNLQSDFSSEFTVRL